MGSIERRGRRIERVRRRGKRGIRKVLKAEGGKESDRKGEERERERGGGG